MRLRPQRSVRPATRCSRSSSRKQQAGWPSWRSAIGSQRRTSATAYAQSPGWPAMGRQASPRNASERTPTRGTVSPTASWRTQCGRAIGTTFKEAGPPNTRMQRANQPPGQGLGCVAGPRHLCGGTRYPTHPEAYFRREKTKG